MTKTRLNLLFDTYCYAKFFLLADSRLALVFKDLVVKEEEAALL